MLNAAAEMLNVCDFFVVRSGRVWGGQWKVSEPYRFQGACCFAWKVWEMWKASRFRETHGKFAGCGGLPVGSGRPMQSLDQIRNSEDSCRDSPEIPERMLTQQTQQMVLLKFCMEVNDSRTLFPPEISHARVLNPTVQEA